MTDPAAEFLRRLDAVENRLEAHAAAEIAPDALTAPDPPTGERWEAGQVWAHLAEFIPYWQGEAELVVEQGRQEPVGFGRRRPMRPNNKPQLVPICRKIRHAVGKLEGALLAPRKP